MPATPPCARLRTKGSMSETPTIAAKVKMPVVPKSFSTQAQAIETITKSAAKSAAVPSSSGLRTLTSRRTASASGRARRYCTAAMAAPRANKPTKDGASVPPAPSGVDGSVLQVATGAGTLEVWGLTLPGGVGASEGLFGVSSSKASGSPLAGSATGGNAAVVSDLPQLAVVEVQGPTVSSSGVDLGTLEGYLLSQPGISPELAAQIRAIAEPSSTLPIPVPAGATSSTTDLNGHTAVVLAAGNEGSAVIWAEHGRLFAVLGQASASDLLDVARQIA